MAETIHVRGEGGAVFTMDLPLPEAIAERLERGHLVRVNADGSAYYGVPAPALVQGSALTEGLVPRPGGRASKADWVLWAMSAHALPEETAEAMTLAALKELPEQPGAGTSPAAADGRPGEDAPKPEWIDHIVKKGLLSREDAEAYTKDDLIAMVS
ncbi:hypothetical protein [Streptomyces sp. TRM68416]|uniref:hypothetical protein n=1 Tax=Streptomyces sp. TRM68416 TaxID=2758412 RepID=UPI001661C332|nr:hypothetical protein [Streptomyces sp. TRM68416]MBD0838790.1 hypothetical protein [Streptomyces sp. TRM68416]